MKLLSELTLAQICTLTGHERTGVARRALRESGIKASGVTLSWGHGDAHPSGRTYRAGEVWRVFGRRILGNIGADVRAMALFREVYGPVFEAAAESEAGKAAIMAHYDSTKGDGRP